MIYALAACTGDPIIDHSPIVQQPDVIPGTPGADPPLPGGSSSPVRRRRSPTPERISMRQTARSLFGPTGSPELIDDSDQEMLPLTPSPAHPDPKRQRFSGSIYGQKNHSYSKQGTGSGHVEPRPIEVRFPDFQ